MFINSDRAQDVWKDIGENVQFTVLKLKRGNLKDDQQAIQNFIDRSQAIIRSLKIRAATSNLKVSIGFSNNAWEYLFPKSSKPKELVTFKTLKSQKYEMPATEGDIFFHIRASNEAVVYEAQTQFMCFLRDMTTVVDEKKGFRYFEGRSIIGFIDGTEAPSLEDSAGYALIGSEDEEFINGSYAFAQQWIHDMDKWNGLSTETQEKAVGRKKASDLELEEEDKFKNAHNIASKFTQNNEEQKIIRMNVPFAEPASGIVGTYFISYSRHWLVTKGMLENMLEKDDFLLSFSTVLSGQLYFIPSRDTLDKIVNNEYN